MCHVTDTYILTFIQNVFRLRLGSEDLCLEWWLNGNKTNMWIKQFIIRDLFGKYRSLCNNFVRLINQNHCLTVREIKKDFGIPKTIASDILSQDLWMRREAAKFVPRPLPKDQKNYQVKVTHDNLETILKCSNIQKKYIRKTSD